MAMVLELAKRVGGLALAATLAAAAQAAEIPQKLTQPEAIAGAISQSGHVHVIVHVLAGLDTPDFQKQMRQPATRLQALKQLRAKVDPVMLSMFPARQTAPGRPVKTFMTLAGFAADVTAAQLAQLQADPRIGKIELDEIKTTSLNQTIPLIDMPPGPDDEPGGAGRTVAVIDTGVQRDHPFIGTDRVVREACFLTTAKCPNGTYNQTGTGASKPASGQSHGTHVSGIAMGHYASGSPVNRGVASKANLVMVNVFGSQSGAYTSDIVQGLEWIETLVVNTGGTFNPLNIDSVNMSLGGGSYTGTCDSDPTKPVIDRLRADGVLTVVAAGNDGSKNAMSSPACVSTTISVAATNKSGVIAGYSNISNSTDVFGPGGDSAAGGCVTSSIPTSAYAAYCGTSMATPHVAGAIAVLRAAVPTASADAIETALESAGMPVTDTRSGGTYTKPLIRVRSALAVLQNMTFHSLALTKSGAGTGTVSSTPAGVSCGPACTSQSGSFVENQQVSMTAAASSNAVFAGWGGDASGCGTASTCSVTLGADLAVTAQFDLASWVTDLNTALDDALVWTTPLAGDSAAWFGQTKVFSDGADAAMSGDIGDSQTSAMQTQVTGPGTLTFKWSVSSESGYDFLRFYIDGVQQSGSISGSVGFTSKSWSISSGTHTLKWAYTKDSSVSSGADAGYVDAVTLNQSTSTTNYKLSLTKSGTSYGTVTSSPSGISCGTSCSSTSALFAKGTSVKLTAQPVSGRRFYSWSGACSGTSLTCTLTMSANKSVTATFK